MIEGMKLNQTSKKLTKSEWLELNGFSQEGKTYIVLGNSYPIKEQLKGAGFRFTQLLRWHYSAKSADLPETCHYHELDFNDYFTWNEEQGIAFMKENARQNIERIFDPIQESNSEYVGEIDEKIENIRCVLKNIGGYNTAYGYRWVYNFVDENGNQFSWHTNGNKLLLPEMIVDLSGTIREHIEYKGIKTTKLVRCKVVPVNQ